MNRLTNNSGKDYQVIDKDDLLIIAEGSVFKPCINKLGQLEDLEEVLKCDLITLFKALKQGYIYVKLEDEIIKRDIDMLNFQEGIRGGVFSKTEAVDNCLQCYQMLNYLSGYGKSWALTRGELEVE